MDATDALDDTLEKAGHEMLNFVDLTNFEDFLELCQEKRLLDAVSEGPVS
jgi:hypothetical protein